jgi:hypothetical protein
MVKHRLNVVMSIIPVFRRRRQEDHEFDARLGYIVRPVSKGTNKRGQPHFEGRGRAGGDSGVTQGLILAR